MSSSQLKEAASKESTLIPCLEGNASHTTSLEQVTDRQPWSCNGSSNSRIRAEELNDPFCDPGNPVKVKFQDISLAANNIRSYIQRTPCQKSRLSEELGMELFIKSEIQQTTGSFKERGARNILQMLNKNQWKNGVITASSGNHALGLSYHGMMLGIPVTVVMPLIAPIMKVTKCKHYGANVIIQGKDMSVAKRHAMKIAKEKGLLYVNGYDHPHVIAGQGTLGLEIMEQVQELDAVVIPIGGGALIAGTALAIKSLSPNTKVIGVESEQCPSFSAALKEGRPVHAISGPSLADGLAVPEVGVNAFESAKDLVDKVVRVREDQIALAILRLVEVEKTVVEGAGACPLAALLSGQLPELRWKRVAMPLCGGNIDTTVLERALVRGLAADGRLCRFVVTVGDRPESIADLTRILADYGARIKDIFHERAWLKSDVFHVQVRVVVETRDAEHSAEIKRRLREKYSQLFWGSPSKY